MGDLVLQDLSSARVAKLHASAQGLLFDVQRRVQAGYVWWLQEKVSASKILAVVAKLGEKFGAFDTPERRYRRKVRGGVSCVLLVWPLRNDVAGYTRVYGLLLLATAHLEGEVMFDARQRPVRVTLYADGSGRFHLRPVARAVAPRRKPSYSWCLIPKEAEQMEARLVQAAKQDWVTLERAISAYRNLPMTAGYRCQLKAALQTAAAHWRRNNRPSMMEVKAQIKKGMVANPFTGLPFISRFPVLYDDPPMRLGRHLDLNVKRQREIARQQAEKVAREHLGMIG